MLSVGRGRRCDAAIRRWANKEMVGDSVTIEPVEVLDHYGDTIVRGRYDGTYDKSNLPGELIMSNYFSVRDGKIVSLAVIFNQPVRIRRNRGMTRRPLRRRPRPRSPATPGIGRASSPTAFFATRTENDPFRRGDHEAFAHLYNSNPSSR
jgi:hypothetical protein